MASAMAKRTSGCASKRYLSKYSVLTRPERRRNSPPQIGESEDTPRQFASIHFLLHNQRRRRVALKARDAGFPDAP